MAHEATFNQPILIVVAAIFGIIVLKIILAYRRNLKKEEARRFQATLDEAERQQQNELARRAEQKSIRSHLATLNAESVKLAENLPKLIQAARTALDRAEYEFNDGAFIPFWDAIEIAATKLATVESGCEQIAANAKTYRQQLPHLDGPKPAFGLHNHALPDGKDVADRLQLVVRPALKNSDFSKIYLMCKQNKILVAGFSTLGETINELGNRLENSVSDVRDELEKTRMHMEEDTDAQREFEKKQLGMLDNIQRRKKPRD